MVLTPTVAAVVVRVSCMSLLALSTADRSCRVTWHALLPSQLQARAPSAALDAFLAAGGRHPGDALRSARELADAVEALPPAASAAQAAADAAGAAHASLLAALRTMPPAVPALDERDADAALDTCVDDADEGPPSATEADAAAPLEQDGPLAGIPTALLRATHRGRCWGEWLALSSCVADSLSRSAALCAAIAHAVHDAPPAPGDAPAMPVARTTPQQHEIGDAVGADQPPPLNVESADAMAQLWALAPFADEVTLRAAVAAAGHLNSAV